MQTVASMDATINLSRLLASIDSMPDSLIDTDNVEYLAGIPDEK